jgi:CheY-like chemotaxis protein
MVPKRTYVLVVDDLADMAESTADLLTLWGYDASACTSGAAALECARAGPPAAVLLDLAMPRMDGFAFARAFRALDGCGDVPVIALSGYAFLAHSDRARDAGIDHCLLKPADADRLRELLAAAVRRVVPPRRGSRRTSRGLRELPTSPLSCPRRDSPPVAVADVFRSAHSEVVLWLAGDWAGVACRGYSPSSRSWSRRGGWTV